MIAATEKLAVASELLDRALRMYYEGSSYFAALHLAGAAEEILGVYVEHHGGESSFRSLQRGAVRISKSLNGGSESKPKDIAAVMNHAKNSTKHMNPMDDDHVHFDAQFQARDLLDRAVSNYYFLMSFYELPETELVRRFNLELVCIAWAPPPKYWEKLLAVPIPLGMKTVTPREYLEMLAFRLQDLLEKEDDLEQAMAMVEDQFD